MTDARVANQPSVALAADDVAAYERDGFLRIERLTSDAEVDSLREVYDRLFEPGAQIGSGDLIELADDGSHAQSLPQILNPDRYAPELLESQAYRNAFAIARQLLGEGATHMGMHAIRKPPRDGAETPWHQDEAYWDPEWEHRALSIWVPLQPATLENGCMHFVPGSHRLEVQDHRLINPTSEGLVLTDQGPVVNPVACPLPAGGATVHANRTLHYAGANRTEEPRRALIMAFRTDPRRRDDDRAFPWQPDRWYED